MCYSDVLKKHLSGNLAKNTIKTTLVFGLRLAAQAVTLICLTRNLGPTVFGEFAAISALAILLGTISTMGTHVILLRETSINPKSRTYTLSYSIPTTLTSGTILLFLYTIISAHFNTSQHIPFLAILIIGVSETILQPLNQLSCGELQGLNKTPEAQTLLTIPLLFRALIIIPLPSNNNFLPIYAIAYGTSAFLTFVIIQQKLPSYWPNPQKWFFPSTENLKDSISYAILSVASYGTLEVDKTIAPNLIGPKNAGIYSTGARILGSLALPVIAMITAATPKIFKDHSEKSTKNLTQLMFVISFLYGLLISLILWISSPFFVSIFGSNYLNLSSTLKLLSFACPALCLRHAACALIMATRHPWLRCYIELSGIFIFTLLSPILVNIYFYNGFLIALSIGEWSMAIISWFYIYNQEKINSRKI